LISQGGDIRARSQSKGDSTIRGGIDGRFFTCDEVTQSWRWYQQYRRCW
jgi:hypothetical protein